MNPYITEAVFLLPFAYPDKTSVRKLCDFFNQTVAELRAMNTHVIVSVFLFDEQLHLLYDYVPLFAIQELSPDIFYYKETPPGAPKWDIITQIVEQRRANTLESMCAETILYYNCSDSFTSSKHTHPSKEKRLPTFKSRKPHDLPRWNITDWLLEKMSLLPNSP
ncbi:MAG: hypothetical protein J6I64_07290 [Lachnospiraceae bacterium]|nr:hypothetical protein [Lachnospiraceae bacterium]